MAYSIIDNSAGAFSVIDENGKLFFIKYNTGDQVWFDPDGSVKRIKTHDNLEFNCKEYQTIDDWYNSLSYSERKDLLNNLHILRHDLEKKARYITLRNLISRLEELHDNYKIKVGYLP